MDQEVDNYVVEHNENFELNKEQFRKLIEAKFRRNTQFARQVKQRESGHNNAD